MLYISIDKTTDGLKKFTAHSVTVDGPVVTVFNLQKHIYAIKTLFIQAFFHYSSC